MLEGEAESSPTVVGTQGGFTSSSKEIRGDSVAKQKLGQSTCSGPERVRSAHNRQHRSKLAEETLLIIQEGRMVTEAGVVSITNNAELSVYYPEDTDFEDCASCDDLSAVEHNQGVEPCRHDVLSEVVSRISSLSVTNETTCMAAHRLTQSFSSFGNFGETESRRKPSDAEHSVRIAMLNFASAKNPGGGFLGGSQAQEECLARSSTLYPSLLRHQNTYYHHVKGENKTAPNPYTDRIIYSPKIVFFRDDQGQLLDSPYLADVITCAAVNFRLFVRGQDVQSAQQEVRQIMIRRAQKVLMCAIKHQVDVLVLGAWGSGVFGNEPREVAFWFREALAQLTERGFADKIPALIFAIPEYSKVQDFREILLSRLTS